MIPTIDIKNRFETGGNFLENFPPDLGFPPV